MGPFVLHDALRGEVEDAGVSAQCEALPERVLKGLDKGNPWITMDLLTLVSKSMVLTSIKP